jgi:hypothetical protein
VNDLVIVMRWIASLGAADGVVQRVLANPSGDPVPTLQNGRF